MSIHLLRARGAVCGGRLHQHGLRRALCAGRHSVHLLVVFIVAISRLMAILEVFTDVAEGQVRNAEVG